MRADRITPRSLEMPALYFERTTPEEQLRHATKLAGLQGENRMLIDPIPDSAGGWHIEIVTTDWDEPGLLDKIFEAILRCIHIPEGIAVRRARIFTGRQGQVVNILELMDRRGRLLPLERCKLVLAQLRQIQRSERGALEAIAQISSSRLIPLVTEIPVIDNDRSDQYTFIEFKVAQVSNRFTSVLLHFLARSEVWLNIQIAEIRQEEEGRYQFYVVDKNGGKLSDSHFARFSLMRAVDDMNHMLMGFNIHSIEQAWRDRIQRNERTIYHSRPDPEDFLRDLETIRKMAQLMGLEDNLSALVDEGLLENHAFFLLKRVETFVEQNGAAIREMVEVPPDAKQIELCRKYFDYRRRVLRFLMPLFEQLREMAVGRPIISDPRRLTALSSPLPPGNFALDQNYRLYNAGSVWLGEPNEVLEPFLLMARTGCFLREDALEAIEAALKGWFPDSIAESRAELGEKFLALLNESIRQGNTAVVLRELRSVGLLQRYLPGFEHIQGLVHVNQDHAYTVDEHSFVVIEVLVGLKVFQRVLPAPGKSTLRSEYEKLSDTVALQKYARKYAMEFRMLETVTELWRNPVIEPFFVLMNTVRENTLEYLVELNFLEYGKSTCLSALSEIEVIRKQLDPLIRLYDALSFNEQRNLVLVGLFHDLKKPAQDHDAQGADALRETLAGMGIELPETDVERIAWLIRHHLEIRVLTQRIGSEGDRVMGDFAAQVGDPSLVRSLILFTYADRVGVSLDPNKNAHDALMLSAILKTLDQGSEAADRAGSGP